jgi:hypothetical protein
LKEDLQEGLYFPRLVEESLEQQPSVGEYERYSINAAFSWLLLVDENH